MIRSDEELRDLYLSPEGAMSAAKFAKKYDITVSRAKTIIKATAAGQIHHAQKKAVYKRIIAEPYSFQIDLMFRKERGVEKVIFCMLEMTSRYAWAVVIPSKESESVYNAFKPILTEVTQNKEEEATMGYIAADDGSEWSKIKTLCEEQHIEWRTVTGEGKGRRMAIVERFNRTLGSKINFSKTNGEPMWVKHIPDYVKSYNETQHSTIGKTPLAAYSSIETLDETRNSIILGEKKQKDYFEIGDSVRVKVYKDNIFGKEKQRWSEDVFTITGFTTTAIMISEHPDRPYQPYELLRVGKVAFRKVKKEEVEKEKEVETEAAKQVRVKKAIEGLGNAEPVKLPELIPYMTRKTGAISEFVSHKRTADGIDHITVKFKDNKVEEAALSLLMNRTNTKRFKEYLATLEKPPTWSGLQDQKKEEVRRDKK